MRRRPLSLPPPLLAAPLLLAAAAEGFLCAVDDDCSLNGVCDLATGACSCTPPWGGPYCATLQRVPPASAAAAAVHGWAPNLTSWGGNAVLGDDGRYHLFVAEMCGGVGLNQWRTNSQVVHAVAEAPEGPYVRQGVALPHQAHNPQAIRYESSWYLFHIGNGSRSRHIASCDNGTAAPVDAWLQSTSPMQQQIHRASSPSGPWEPLPMTLPYCNNPSPWAMSNGTVLVACDGPIYAAPSPAGPWRKVADVPRWMVREDNFLWQDARGWFHMITHWDNHSTTADVRAGRNVVSGHVFSRDGVEWQVRRSVWDDSHDARQPYPAEVALADGSRQVFSSLERPKLVFAADGRTATHLITGASPLWGGCDACCYGGECGMCTSCKITGGLDWTYTLVQRLGT